MKTTFAEVERIRDGKFSIQTTQRTKEELLSIAKKIGNNYREDFETFIIFTGTTIRIYYK